MCRRQLLTPFFLNLFVPLPVCPSLRPSLPSFFPLPIPSLLLSAAVCPSAWLSILKRLQLSPSMFISQRVDSILSIIERDIATRREACLSATATLLHHGAEDILRNMVEMICSMLCSQDVLGVTSEQLEIMYTPEGLLWHQGMSKEYVASDRNVLVSRFMPMCMCSQYKTSTYLSSSHFTHTHMPPPHTPPHTRIHIHTHMHTDLTRL